MSTRQGPPETVRPGDHHDARPHHKAHQIQAEVVYSTTSRQYVDALRRRRASYRLPALESGRSDPWWYQPPGPRGYEQAVLHLLERGLLPAPNREGLRVIHRLGGASRNAAQHIAQAWELAAWLTLMT
jgi:hypothetical protein